MPQKCSFSYEYISAILDEIDEKAMDDPVDNGAIDDRHFSDIFETTNQVRDKLGIERSNKV
jgi:hypothetical protein